MKMGVKRDLETAGILDNDAKITEAEAALYDRQIRLWGMDCQKRLREAKLLVIGLNGVGAEAVKNLTLSGVKSITILDDAEVSPIDAAAQFFVAGSKPGAKRAEASVSAIQELNPNVKIHVINGDIFSKPEDYFNDFDALIATDCNIDVLIKLNELCRKHSIQFYCADTWGFYGYCFLDLNVHKCKSSVPELPKDEKGEKKPKTDKVITKDHTLNYSTLGPVMLTKVGEGLKKRVNKGFVLIHVINHFREIFNRNPSAESRDEDVKELLKLKQVVCKKLDYNESRIPDEILDCVFGQLSPVCAVIGGILANEIIKGISRDGLPILNFFLFDGNESVGVNEGVLV